MPPVLGQSVAILACARNCARYLQRSLRNLEFIAAHFHDHRIYLFENDSSDNTGTILSQFTSADAVRRKMTRRRFLIGKVPGRTRRLAYVRQCLKHQLLASGYRPDVVVVVDVDDVGARPTFPTLTRFLIHACAFAGWDAAFPMLSYDRAAWLPLKNASLPDPHEGRAVRVRSSFNGIGVYKSSVYARGTYILPGQRIFGRHARPGPCEHITFHASLGPAARLAMLPCSYP